MHTSKGGMFVAGDFCPINRLGNFIGKGNEEFLFNDLLPIIKGSDLAIINLECPLTDVTTIISKTGPLLKASESAAELLLGAGFRLVTLANNHVMDYGLPGLISTLEACRRERIDTVGAGFSNSEARRIYYSSIDGRIVAVLNFSENEFSTTPGKEPGANPMDLIANCYDIKEAGKQADYVFVIVHCGHERYDLPSPRLKKTFRFYADAGASAIFGHHPHCYSGYEVYNGKPLFYSLGNFLFDDPENMNELWYSGFAVELSLKESLTFKIHPYEQCRVKMGVELMKGSELERFNSNLARINALISDDEQLETEFDKYCKRVSRMYGSFLEPYSSGWLRMLQKMKLSPSLLSNKKKKLYLNLTRCESHRDVVIRILERQVSDLNK